MSAIVLRYGPYAAIAVLFWLWIDTEKELAAEIERCNTDKLQSALEQERIARNALVNANAERVRQLEEQASRAIQARNIAEAARIEAEARPERVRTVIREVASEDGCVDSRVPERLAQCLRDENC